MKRKIIAALSLACFAVSAFASNVKWTAKVLPADARAGESAQVVLTVQIASGWHIYRIGETAGPTATSFKLDSKSLTEQAAAVEPPPKTIMDPNFQATVGEYETAAAFAIPVKIGEGLSGSKKTVVAVTDQTCNAHVCALPETIQVPVSFSVSPGAARPDRLQALTSVPAQPAGYSGGGAASQESAPAASKSAASSAQEGDIAKQIKGAEDKGLLYFALFAFLLGLAALATPCVFPMIPITVSFFAKSGGENKRNYAGAVSYCAGIVGTFTVLGLLFTFIFGASGISNLAANPWVNLVLAAVFIVLALSLFGLFEIRLPSSLLNMANKGTKKRGLAAPFFMGLTFTLTSFTCTAPLVGGLLTDAAQGQVLYPIVGLLAFGVAFASPFFLLALFPQYLANLPKSGSWLNVVKGFMAFIEIAAAVKFLSNADLVWQLGILTRPIFLAVWAIIGAITALYLFGFVSLDGESTGKVGLGRVGVGIASLAATFFFLSGVGGHTQGYNGFLLAWLPPVPYPGQLETSGPGDIRWIGDYKLALAKARSSKQPLFIDFTGVTCTNCRAMEEQMFPRPEVRKLIDGFIPVQLYTDRPTDADRFNAHLEQQLANQTTLPMYVIVSPDGKPIKAFSGYTQDTGAFVSFLQAGRGSQVASLVGN